MPCNQNSPHVTHKRRHTLTTQRVFRSERREVVTSCWRRWSEKVSLTVRILRERRRCQGRKGEEGEGGEEGWRERVEERGRIKGVFSYSNDPYTYICTWYISTGSHTHKYKYVCVCVSPYVRACACVRAYFRNCFRTHWRLLQIRVWLHLVPSSPPPPPPTPHHQSPLQTHTQPILTNTQPHGRTERPSQSPIARTYTDTVGSTSPLWSFNSTDTELSYTLPDHYRMERGAVDGWSDFANEPAFEY